LTVLKNWQDHLEDCPSRTRLERYRYGMYILKMASYSRDRLTKYIQMLQERKVPLTERDHRMVMRFGIGCSALKHPYPFKSNLAVIGSGDFRNTPV